LAAHRERTESGRALGRGPNFELDSDRERHWRTRKEGAARRGVRVPRHRRGSRSETVAHRYRLAVSPHGAHVMASWKSWACCATHTSADASDDRGLRYYVTRFCVCAACRAEQNRSVIAGPLADPQDVMQRVARVLRDLSHLRWWSRRRAGVGRGVAHRVRAPARRPTAGVIASQSGQIQNKLIPSTFSLAERSRPYQQLLNGLCRLDPGPDARAPGTRNSGERKRSAGDPVLAQALKLAMAATPALSRAATSSSMTVHLLAAAADLDRLVACCAPWKRKTDRQTPGAYTECGRHLRVHRRRGQPADLTEISVVAAATAARIAARTSG